VPLDRPRGPLPTRVSDLPELPRSYHDVLDDGLLDLGLDLGPGARSVIDGHVRLLLAWTSAINLTSVRDPVEVARAHVLDSLSAVQHLRARGAGRLLDIGSGGGYPGLPLAVALDIERALLVDSIAKKVRFLRVAIEAMDVGGRIGAEAARAEALAHDRRHREAWPAVTARAVAPLAELAEVGLPLVAPGGVLVAWKGSGADREVVDAAAALSALRAGPVEVIPAGVPGLDAHRLVIVPRGGPIDAVFPRDPAERRRHPL
jgi:16S rRNA (guanine527-N7)-methyltransferase